MNLRNKGKFGMRRKVANDLCLKMKSAPSRAVARAVFSKYPELFKSIEDARGVVRWARGEGGSRSRTGNSSLMPVENKVMMPRSIAKPWEPVILTGQIQRMLVLSDLHVPFHDEQALEAAINHDDDYDTVLINGDLMDCWQLKFWPRDPTRISLKEEIEAGVQMLTYIRQRFNKARIILKEGNHDEGFYRWFWSKAPEVVELTNDGQPLSIRSLFKLDDLDIQLISEKRKVKVDKLNIIHGHEFGKGGGMWLANTARYVRLKANGCVLAGHWHRSNNDSCTTIDNEFPTVWTMGCLCDLSPDYARINQWNHGFAVVEWSEKGGFGVQNYRIRNGKVHS